MTKKEAIKRLKEIDIRDALQEDYDALYMAIEALEQEPKTDVLDKIKTEIEQIVDEQQEYDGNWATGLRYAVKIIDKYRESEEQYDKRKGD